MLIEAKKLAYADLYAYNADPNFAKVPLEKLLSDEYAKSLCSRIDAKRASGTAAGETSPVPATRSCSRRPTVGGTWSPG